jgi:hypothetical protein
LHPLSLRLGSCSCFWLWLSLLALVLCSHSRSPLPHCLAQSTLSYFLALALAPSSLQALSLLLPALLLLALSLPALSLPALSRSLLSGSPSALLLMHTVMCTVVSHRMSYLSSFCSYYTTSKSPILFFPSNRDLPCRCAHDPSVSRCIHQ